jgi:hypothetical protein
MPFSNSTKRQRWEKGQVVPEYSTIMAKTPKNQKEWAAQASPLQNAPAQPRRARTKRLVRTT